LGDALSYAAFTTELRAVAAVSVLLGLYLIYALRRRLGVNCPLCYTAHAINTGLLLILLVAR
jgi:uncharacterized membrane protein